MLKTFRRWLGLCEHQWSHVSNILTTQGIEQVMMCDKCLKMSYRTWPR